MGHEFLLFSSHTSHDDRMVHEKLRTTAAFEDEGTSAVEMSVEAALYGVTWSQQIQSAVAKPMLVDDFLYGVILCYTIMLYYVILCYTIQYFGNYHNPFPLPFLASADWTNMICKPVIRNCEKNCSAVHCSWALPSAFASNRQVVLTMLMHHFCPHSTIAKQGWRWHPQLDPNVFLASTCKRCMHDAWVPCFSELLLCNAFFGTVSWCRFYTFLLQVSHRPSLQQYHDTELVIGDESTTQHWVQFVASLAIAKIYIYITST